MVSKSVTSPVLLHQSACISPAASLFSPSSFLFRPLSIDNDMKKIQQLDFITNRNSCDYCYGNLFCWKDVYRYMVAIGDEYVVLSQIDPQSKKSGYLMPMCMDASMRASLIDSLTQDGSTLFSLSEEDCSFIRAHIPGKWKFENDRNLDEYVYFAEAFRTYSGKSMHAKKNHYNKFIKTCGDQMSYEEINDENVDECLEMSDEWRRENEAEGAVGVVAEENVIRCMLKNRNVLGLLGGCIRVNHKIVGFTLGEAAYPQSNTMVVHVEKASYEIPGLYPALASLFLQHHPQFTLVNREEDLGIDGLRQSKLSYQPSGFIQKYSAVRQ